MKISVVQFTPEFGKKDENLKSVLSYISEISAELIVFPELALTGYFFQSREESAACTEPFDGPSIIAIADAASKENKIVVIGFAELDDDKIYNSAALLFPDKKLNTVHRKTHLFYKERFCFDPGNTGYFVVEDPASGCRIGTMICYDWRFPEAAHTLAMNGADLIVCPSNLVTPYWPNAMPARALENKVWLAVANRCGSESGGGEEVRFNGRSAIYNFNGELMSSAPEAEDCVISAEIDPAATRDKSFNPYNDIFKDRRPEMYFRNPR